MVCGFYGGGRVPESVTAVADVGSHPCCTLYIVHNSYLRMYISSTFRGKSHCFNKMLSRKVEICRFRRWHMPDLLGVGTVFGQRRAVQLWLSDSIRHIAGK
jgi:hypothetical protein